MILINSCLGPQDTACLLKAESFINRSYIYVTTQEISIENYNTTKVEV